MADFIGGHMIDIPDIPSAQDFIDIVKDLEAAAAGSQIVYSSGSESLSYSYHSSHHLIEGHCSIYTEHAVVSTVRGNGY